jgi:UDP-glucose:(heptosyl)LPS alpha-1,3-glucosyltransferase
MRIALVHKKLDRRGGTENDFYRTAEGLRDLGHEVHLFCASYDIDPPRGTFAHRVPVIPLGRSARLWSFAFAAPKEIRGHNCAVVVNFGRLIKQDVVRSGGGSHRVFLEKLAAEHGTRRRVWQTLSPYHRSLLAMEKRQFWAGHFKRVLAVSELVRRELLEVYRVPPERVTVLANGVDHERFHPSLRAQWRARVREQWGIPLDASVVLMIGSGFRRKGLDRLLNVWCSSQLKDAYLLVVGDDARFQRYKTMADQIAKGRVVFTGRQERVERFYGAADVLALPSLQEAFGNVVLEALASGLPVVVSRSVGASELLRGALVQGIVERPENMRELEDKLAMMLRHSRRPDGAAESRHLAEEYSWKNHFRKLEDCLIQVSQQDGGKPLI